MSRGNDRCEKERHGWRLRGQGSVNTAPDERMATQAWTMPPSRVCVAVASGALSGKPPWYASNAMPHMIATRRTHRHFHFRASPLQSLAIEASAARSKSCVRGITIVTKPVPTLMIAVAAPLLAGAIYLAVPALRPAEAAVMIEADQHVEAARRLLFAYGENEERIAQILGQLEADNIDVTLSGDDTERIVDENPEAIEEIEDRLGELTRGRNASRVRELEDKFQEAGGASETPLLQSGGLGGGTNAVLRSMRDGVRQRDAILQQNAKLLDEALAKVNAALAVSHGEISASEDQYANGVKGIILVAKAGVAQREAWHLRARADSSRRELVALSGLVQRLAINQELVQRSQVDDSLEALVDESREFKRNAREKEEEISAIDAKIADLKARLASSQGKANAARDAMESLQEQGANLLESTGSQDFADRYVKLSNEYDTALAVAHRLERGTLLNARIDDTGDYVRGQFVPTQAGGEIVVQRGLADYENDRDTTARDLATIKETLAVIEEGIEALRALKGGYEDKVAEAEARAKENLARAAEVYTRFDQQITEADAAMERAATTARQAARAFRTAGRAASDGTRDATAKLDPLGATAKERSPFKLRSADRWQAGQLDNESAQAKHVLASVLYDRFAAAASDFDLLTRVKADLELADADPDAMAQRRDTAREEAAESARDAIADFEKSFRPLNNNWTVPAAAAAAHDLLSLLENPEHTQTAITNYEHAVTGNESQPYAKPFLERLDILRNR